MEVGYCHKDCVYREDKASYIICHVPRDPREGSHIKCKYVSRLAGKYKETYI